MIPRAILNRLLDAITDDRLGALAAAFCLAFAPAALLAAISPCCVRLLLRETHKSGALSGRLSAVVTLGSILGALSTSFFLIPIMGVKAIYLSLAVLSAAFAGLTLVVSMARSRYEAGVAARALACAAAVGAIQGLLIGVLGINSLVFTIGTLIGLRGLAMVVAHEQTITMPIEQLPDGAALFLLRFKTDFTLRERGPPSRFHVERGPPAVLPG